jgi:two-component system sensor histidine kinase KdpD
VYLGAAPGVGKTFAMLAEAHRRRARGTDVVVGFVEPHHRPHTEQLVEGLEVLPRRVLPHRGTTRTELDVEAVLARRPDVVLVDELAHANAPGSRNAWRWQDVEELLDAGIDVVSTLNVAHLESLQDTVVAIIGVRPTESVPDLVVRRADQIELVDMSPEALRRRVAHGNVLDPDTVVTGLTHFFRPGNLSALRELALLWLADRVDDALETYRVRQGIDEPWSTRERVVVGLTGGDGDEVLVRRAARIARSTAGGELLAVHVSRPGDLSETWAAVQERDRELVAGLGGSFHRVVGVDPAAALLAFARGANASQIVVGAGRRRRAWRRFRESVGEAVSRQPDPFDVHLVPLNGGPTGSGTTTGRRRISGVAARRRPVALGPPRQTAGWALAVAGPVLLVAVMSVGRDRLSLSTHAMVFLLLTVGVALMGGLWPALVAAVAGGLLLNWFFTPPYATFTIADPQNAFTLVAFVLVAAAVSSVVDLAERRSLQAGRSAREAEALSLLARSALQGDHDADAVLARLGQTLQMTSACLLERPDEREPWRPVAAWGGPACTCPDAADESVTLTPGLVLALHGRTLPADDRRMLEAFAAQAAALLERQRLRQRAREAADLAHGNAVRTALLAAVSHDLRTPLASVKAAISSLRQPDVRFAPEDEAELLATVEEGADRLESLIENLLDVTRLQTGAVQPLVTRIALDEVVPRALAGLPPERVRLEIDEALPMIRTDVGLLERIIANVTQNAVTHSASAQPVVVTASVREGTVVIRVVDRGRGVPDAHKDRMFSPFQRVGEAPPGSGVGLGLAVARGFAHALGGTLDAEDTPGGGLTMVLALPTGGEAAGDPGGTMAAVQDGSVQDGTVQDGTGAGQQ